MQNSWIRNKSFLFNYFLRFDNFWYNRTRFGFFEFADELFLIYLHNKIFIGTFISLKNLTLQCSALAVEKFKINWYSTKNQNIEKLPWKIQTFQITPGKNSSKYKRWKRQDDSRAIKKRHSKPTWNHFPCPNSFGWLGWT